MRLKFLYTLSLLLCLSTFASSNERAHYCRPNCPAAPADSAGKKPVPVASASGATSFPILRLLSI